jgi:hypothetical protein
MRQTLLDQVLVKNCIVWLVDLIEIRVPVRDSLTLMVNARVEISDVQV